MVRVSQDQYVVLPRRDALAQRRPAESPPKICIEPHTANGHERERAGVPRGGEIMETERYQEDVVAAIDHVKDQSKKGSAKDVVPRACGVQRSSR